MTPASELPAIGAARSSGCERSPVGTVPTRWWSVSATFSPCVLDRNLVGAPTERTLPWYPTVRFFDPALCDRLRHPGPAEK